MEDVNATKNFRYNVRAWCDARGISQRGLAELVGASYPHINRVLQGHADPSLDFCERISLALKLPLEDMIAHPEKFSEAHLTTVSV